MSLIRRLLMLIAEPHNRVLRSLSDQDLLSLFCAPGSAENAVIATEELGCRIINLHQKRLLGRRQYDPDATLQAVFADLFQKGSGGLVAGNCDFETYVGRAIWRAQKDQKSILATRNRPLTTSKDSGIPLEEQSDRHPSQMAELEKRELWAAIEEALADLSEVHRQCLQMRYWENAKVSDIARKLKLSRHRVEQHLERTHNKLRSLLGPLAPATIAVYVLLNEQAYAAPLSAALIVSSEPVGHGLIVTGSPGGTSLVMGKAGSLVTASKIGIAAITCVLISGGVWYALSTVQEAQAKPRGNQSAVVSSNASDSVPRILTTAPNVESELATTPLNEVANNEPLYGGFPRNPANGTIHVFRSEYFEADFPFAYCAGVWVGQTEVTQRQWSAVSAVSKLKTNPSYRRGEVYPVESVTPQDANDFCRYFTAAAGVPIRLLSITEWDIAASAGREVPDRYLDDPNNNPTGAEIENEAWYKDNSRNMSHPVGLKKPNPWGLKDIYGNLFEIIGDAESDYYVAGGYFGSKAFWCKTGYASGWIEGDRKADHGTGFRIAFKPAE